MQKRTAVIGAALSLMPWQQPLVTGMSAAFTSVTLIISSPEKGQAEASDFYIGIEQKKFQAKDFYGCISDFTKAVELQVSSNYSSYAYRRRGHCKFLLNDLSGSLFDNFSAAIFIASSQVVLFNDPLTLLYGVSIL